MPENDLDALERDLSFHPVDNPAPRHLSREQVDGYNERGYVFPLDAFTPEQAGANRDYFDRMMAETERRGGNSYSINGYHGRCAGLYDIVATPRLLDFVEDILGPSFVAWGTHFFCKTPHDPKAVPWHQDASYWPLTPSKTVTAWVAIDDVDVENSAMRFVAGSHRHGHLEWKPASGEFVLGQEVVNAEGFGEIEDVEMRAGQVSLHSDMLIHGSKPNASARRRCGLTIRYASTDVRPLKPGWGAASILCRGRDEYGHWNHCERPAGEDYALPTWEKPRGE